MRHIVIWYYDSPDVRRNFGRPFPNQSANGFSRRATTGRKTALARQMADLYLNYDNLDDRRAILRGPAALAAKAELDRPRTQLPLIAMDEIHKFLKWKSFLKGFFDGYGRQCRVLATGSARMDIFRKGGDSLLGRYFLYRQHPFSVGEILRPQPPRQLLRDSSKIDSASWDALWNFGGFPEPMLKQSSTFLRKWQANRIDLLLREDVRDLTRVQELRSLETLGHILASRSSHQLIFSNLAREISVSVDTVRRWIAILSYLYIGFELKPWFKNVAKALRSPQIVTFATHGFFLPTQETKLEDRNLAMGDNTRAVVQ